MQTSLSSFCQENCAYKLLFLGLSLFVLSPWAGPGIALGLGVGFALLFGTPFLQVGKWAKSLLKYAVVGLGFGLNIAQALQAGKEGFVFTLLTILGTLSLGYVLGRVLRVPFRTSFLVATGTAICGGSAIAAVAPVLAAKEEETSVALGAVFILNAVGLVLFPALGHLLGMGQYEFGLWAAIAIHDTSSVVGAAAAYGEEALQVATTVKLTRALWIIPVAFATAFWVGQQQEKKKKGQEKVSVTIPWFIGAFFLAALVRYLLPQLEFVFVPLVKLAKLGLVLTLFFIGAGLSKARLQSVGWRPFALALGLWLVCAVAAYWGVQFVAG
jgi:uncharacterized integral membrane protein (TIGR00698 family)